MNKGLIFTAGLVFGLGMMKLSSSNNELLEIQSKYIRTNSKDISVHVGAVAYPANGYVPDEETAIAIAEAVIIPIYGKRRMKSERPYKAKLKENDIWIVWGNLPFKRLGIMGGTIQVEISKIDGRILEVYTAR